MTCHFSDSKCLCNFEFEVLALYLNFKDKSLWDVRYAIDHFIQKTKIDLDKITTVFCYYSWDFCSQYGQFTEMENINYLNSLGREQYNFFTDWMDLSCKEDDYINMYNFVTGHKSIAVFYGEMDSYAKNEFENYQKCQKVPCITITPNEYCKVFWVGIPDSEYEILYGTKAYNYLNH